MLLLIFKALHIVGFVAWFSGMFYLVRMFVYHVEASEKPEPEKSVLEKQFALMEQRVYRLIMNPAMMITFTFGIGMLIINPAFLKVGWMHFKLLFVVILLGYHLYCKGIIKKLANGTNTFGSFEFRMMNEVPTIFLLGIVLLAVLKTSVSPFLVPVIMLGAGVLIYILARVYQKKREG